uniref:Reverse transcriptase Ty1/copia-type domain-containing protein n=1 Tax=Tanacetum cinerariifolium TaxID=118510 RepID=A0A6L2M150_TANCI|nr:hypothetical protein [Tanacetum cinerariifolium]
MQKKQGRKEPEFKGRKPKSEVNVSPSSSAQLKKHDDKTKKEAKGKSPVESLTRYRNLSVEFKDFSDNNINKDNVAGTLVPVVGQFSPNSTNTFSAAGLSNAAGSPTHGKSSYVDSSQLHDDPNMPKLEYIPYSNDDDDVGAEADFNNLATSITVSPILTTRVHKDHPMTEIISDLSLATQTRSMIRVAKDQGGLSQINSDDFHTSYSSFMGFMVYQMDVKSTVMYGTIEEEVYVYQPPGFEDPDHPDKVYKVVKKEDGIFISHDKYVAETLRKFGLTDGKSASTPIVTPKASHLHEVKWIFRYLKGKPHLGLWYPRDSPFDLVAYSDSDYAGASLDRKSTTKGFNSLDADLSFRNNTVAVKKVNDVTRLQALVDKKKVVVTEATIRDALLLEDADGVEGLPNEEILTELERIGNMESTVDIIEFFKKLKFVCHWADPFKNLKWSNALGVKLSLFSESDDTFLSLQASSNLYYLLGGLLDYL